MKRDSFIKDMAKTTFIIILYVSTLFISIIGCMLFFYGAVSFFPYNSPNLILLIVGLLLMIIGMAEYTYIKRNDL